MDQHLMPDPLLADTGFTTTTYIVIDFEGTTPKGHRPEPIEVAAMALCVSGEQLSEAWRFDGLMCPPEHAPVTGFDATQTGITAAMVANAPRAGKVLSDLDGRLVEPPYLLVAHNSPTEAGILYDYRESCPAFASIDLLDTVKLARIAYPNLHSHRLDVLLEYLAIPCPPDRHRAMPDVEVTAQLFARLLAGGRWRTLQQLHAASAYSAKATRPQQESLFD